MGRRPTVRFRPKADIQFISNILYFSSNGYFRRYLLRDFPAIGLYKGDTIDAEYSPIGVVYLAKRSVNDEYQETFYSGAIEGKDYEKDSDENSH